MLLGKKSQDGISLREETGEAAEKLLANGYLPVEKVGELPSANYYETLYEVSEDGTKLLQSFYVPPPEPRTFSKLKILQAAAQMGLATDFLTLLQSDVLLYNMWLAAQNIAEDNQFFKSGVETIKQQLHLTDEQIESILSNCVI